MTEQLSFLHSYRVIWILQSDRGEHEHFSDELDTTTLLSSVLSLEVCISYLDIKVKYHHDDRAVPCNEASQQNLSLLCKISPSPVFLAVSERGLKSCQIEFHESFQWSRDWDINELISALFQISRYKLNEGWSEWGVKQRAESPHVNTNPVFFTHSTSHLSPLS